MKTLKNSQTITVKFSNHFRRDTYDKQLSAKRYMMTIGDSEVERFAIRQYPDDCVMQKYTYNKQLSAKRYMSKTTNSYAKNKATRQYPRDYSMQKYIYDREAF